MKTEPTGTISVDTDTLKALGLTADDCSETELKLVAGFMLSRPILTSEAALSLLSLVPAEGAGMYLLFLHFRP